MANVSDNLEKLPEDIIGGITEWEEGCLTASSRIARSSPWDGRRMPRTSRGS